MKHTKYLQVLVLMAGLLVFSAIGFADPCDLTVPLSSCTINNAIYSSTEPTPVGSGVIDSFVRISTNNDIENGYNTSARPLHFDENSSPIFTHDILLLGTEVQNVGGTDYYVFHLDINQTGSAPLLSLDEVQIFTSSTSGQSVDSFTGAGVLEISGNLVYRLDAGGDNEVVLNYNINGGSGQGDMVLLVPVGAFGAVDPGSTYVYLYSAFGGMGTACDGVYFDNTGHSPITGSCGNNDGYEEWYRVQTSTPVPEPATLTLLGTGLLGLGAKLRRRNKKKA